MNRILLIALTPWLLPVALRAQEPEPPKPATPSVPEHYARRSSDEAKRISAIAGSTGAVQAGLKWLAAHQSPDGRFDSDGFMNLDEGKPCDGPGNATYDVGLTGLGLLAFLGAGHSGADGPYKDAVRRAAGFLVAQQDPKSGLLGTRTSHSYIYNHAIGTLALVEAAGLRHDAATRDAAQRALDYLERHRNPYAVWRYQPRDNDNDLSVTAWAIMAWVTARDFGFKVNPQVESVANSYLQMVTDEGTGRYGYTRRGERSSRNIKGHGREFPPEETEALTAAGTWTHLLLRRGRDKVERSELIDKSIELLDALPPTHAKKERIDYYYWMYASHVMYQAGGLTWKKWAHALSDAVVMRQRRDGNFNGSWDPSCVWGCEGGRLYSTAMAVLMLESEYRFARWLQPAAAEAKKAG